jgi:methyltransferase
MTVTPVAAGIAIFTAMLLEARLSARHDRDLRAQGATEPAGDVYPLMQLVYPAAFVAMIAEGLWRRIDVDAIVVTGASVFLFAKALKYWAMATLGPRWTFRVLVPPRSTRTVSGPYRWLNHPNYVAVAGELAGTAIAMHAGLTGPVAVIAFMLIMRARIRVEERALSAR